MNKFKYVAEFEINASIKMLYPYLATPNGLSDWFAEKVSTVDQEEKIYDIVWDNASHLAKLVSLQTNKHVKFVFLDDDHTLPDDPSYLEFKISHNEMTETTFLKVIDYSEIDSAQDLKELWNNLIQSLLELIGAKETT
jgi:uncharacterized protein YndB with AHSA1/START domain